MLHERGLDPGRVKMAAICSVCAEPFVNHMKQFGKSLAELPSGAAVEA
jgi:F420-non-reducing hydrogenase iron-sulfur subunit